MKVMGNVVYQLGVFEVDTSQNCLRRAGIERHVRRKTFQVLVYLIENRERVVSKEELIETFWVDTAVTDDTVVQCLLEIRKALGDDSRRPSFVKTIPKVGYRFIGAVEELSYARQLLHTEEITTLHIEVEETDHDEAIKPEKESRADWFANAVALIRRRPVFAALALTLAIAVGVAGILWRQAEPVAEVETETSLPIIPGRKTLAVMHFENRSGATDVDWLREGLADMLITNLSRSKKLSILSRQQLHLLLERMGRDHADAIRLDEAQAVAQKSGAGTVILGSFAKVGEATRVDAQIHDTTTGSLIAAEGFTSDTPAQLLAQVDALSLKLAAHLGANPTETELRPEIAYTMTSSLDAYRYYSLALEQSQMYQFQEAITLLEKAVALDSQFALAYARMGYVYAVLWGLKDKAKPALEKAAHLADRLSDKDKLYLAAWSASVNNDADSAIRSYRQIIARYSLEVEAYQRLGWLLLQQDKYEEALTVIKQGMVIDPDFPDFYNALGRIHLHTGREKEAHSAYERYVELSPDDPNAYDSLANCFQWFGHYDLAIELYNRALAINPESGVAILHLGNTYFQQGRYQAALDQYRRYVEVGKSDWQRGRGYAMMAWVYLKCGDLNRAADATKLSQQFYQTVPWERVNVAIVRGDHNAERLRRSFLEEATYEYLKERGFLRAHGYTRGYLALRDGKAVEACEHFREALRHNALIWHIDPYEDCLANAFLQLGRLDEAIAEYERILRINPAYPLAHYRLGLAFERKGERDRATAAYEKFLQVWSQADADVPEVIDAKKRLAAF